MEKSTGSNLSFSTVGLTKFDKRHIRDAFDRCYGLKQAIQNDTRGCYDELAHQTGYRASYLKEHAQEVLEL